MKILEVVLLRHIKRDTNTLDILGDGTGGKVSVTVNANGKITDAVVSNGGKNYTYGIVNLKPIQASSTINAVDRAKLIPIIPPSRGHGFDLYSELGADKVLVYARFDDSSPDFPTDTKFSQVGIVKNPEQFSSDSAYTGSTFTSTHAIKLSQLQHQHLQLDKKLHKILQVEQQEVI